MGMIEQLADQRDAEDLRRDLHVEVAERGHDDDREQGVPQPRQQSKPVWTSSVFCVNAANPPISEVPKMVYAIISEKPDISPSGRPRPWLTNVYMPPAARTLRHICT